MTDAIQPPRGWLRQFLSLIGVVVVSWNTTSELIDDRLAVWAFVTLSVATLAWLVLLFVPERSVAPTIVCMVLMLVGGAITAPATNGVGIVPVAVSLLWMLRDLRIPLRLPIALGLLAMIAILVGGALRPINPLALVAMEAGVVVAFLSGQSRRQFLVAERQSWKLRESDLAVREQQAKTTVLAARQQIAHDMHDVLAHSLGGLVIQLDAVDALLEAGDTDAAASRAREARVLAVEGLTEARRAVAALRDGPELASAAVPAEAFAANVAELAAAHRSLGGNIELSVTGEPRDLDGALEAALRRALQEGLTNARKHAADEPVRVRIDWSAGVVAMTIENAIPGPQRAASSPTEHGVAPSTGGGHGLVGMRERFGTLPGGSAGAGLETDGDSGGTRGARWVVRVRGAAP
jgi:signal transduction histidine kinase